MNLKSTRDGFGEAMVELASKNKNIVVVDADLQESLKLSRFASKFPARFIEVGVAEQNMIGVAAGLAMLGKTVFATSFACFSPAICWNNIRISVCYSKVNVKVVGSHGGLATGPDGASHQAIEDIALMRVLPNMTVLVPADYEQAKQLTVLAAEHQGPVYLRLARPEIKPIFNFDPLAPTKSGLADRQISKIGGSEILREGTSLTIIGCGPILIEALKVADELDAEVINCYSVKPIDKNAIIKSVEKTKRVLTIEDHSVIGGLGGAVAELLSSEYPVLVKTLGVKDVFGESARDYYQLWQKYGLDSNSILKEAKEILKK